MSGRQFGHLAGCRAKWAEEINKGMFRKSETARCGWQVQPGSRCSLSMSELMELLDSEIVKICKV
jgi:hypothetical protein